MTDDSKSIYVVLSPLVYEISTSATLDQERDELRRRLTTIDSEVANWSGDLSSARLRPSHQIQKFVEQTNLPMKMVMTTPRPPSFLADQNCPIFVRN